MAAHVFRWIDDHLYWKPLWVIVIFHRNLNLMYFVSLILSHLSPVHITLTFSLVLICARVFILCSLSVKRKRKKEREWSREGGYGRKLQSLMWGKPFGMRNELSESLVSLSVHSCNVWEGRGRVGKLIVVCSVIGWIQRFKCWIWLSFQCFGWQFVSTDTKIKHSSGCLCSLDTVHSGKTKVSPPVCVLMALRIPCFISTENIDTCI